MGGGDRILMGRKPEGIAVEVVPFFVFALWHARFRAFRLEKIPPDTLISAKWSAISLPK